MIKRATSGGKSGCKFFSNPSLFQALYFDLRKAIDALSEGGSDRTVFDTFHCLENSEQGSRPIKYAALGLGKKKKGQILICPMFLVPFLEL